MSGNQVERWTPDGGKSKNNMSTPQWGGHNTHVLTKVAKIETFQFCIEYFPTTLWVKNSVQIALSLTVSEILRFFRFFAKIQDGRQKWRKLNFLNFVQNTFLLPYGSKILSKSLYLLQFLRY